jgi:hypothetical protein
MDWSFLQSKLFWVNVLSVIILIIQQAVAENIVPLQYAAWAALAITVLSDVITLIQNGQMKAQIKKLKAK